MSACIQNTKAALRAAFELCVSPQGLEPWIR